MTGPPFAPHPTSAEDIHAHAEGLAIYAGGSYRLAGNVRHAFATAQSGVSGVLVGPVLTAPKRFYDTADQLHLSTMYAAGCLTLFANAVRAFNTGIDHLNAEWAAAVADDFGVAPVSPDAARTRHGTDPAKLADAEADWTLAIDTARRELAADLRRRHHRLEGHLDEAAHDVAMRLRRGPTHDGVRALMRDGVFRQLFDALEDRLFQATPDRPTAIETLMESGQPYICDDMGCRPTYTYPGTEDDGSEFGNIGDLAAGTIGGITETVDQIIPDELSIPTFNPYPGRADYPLDIPDQPLTDPYEQLARDVGVNPDSDLYTTGTWLPLPTAAGGARLTGKLTERLLLRYTRRTATHETIDTAEDATKLVPGGGLAAHEGIEGSHTIARHVGLTDQQLLDRVLNGTKEASTFTDQTTAENAISHVIDANQAKIKAWLASGTKHQLILSETTGKNLGRYVDQATLTIQNDVRSVQVVLRPSNALGLGYRIHTAYPRP
jgi:hypothetical protein